MNGKFRRDCAAGSGLVCHVGERGAALLMVLLIAGLVSMVAVAMVSRQQVDIRRAANVLDGDQAYVLAESVEAFATGLLARDAEESSTDHLGEDWAFGLFPTEVSGAVVSGFLEDMQGRFNLNNLAAGGPDSADRVSSRKQFQRLLEMCEGEPDLVQAVEDWLDPDLDPLFPGGAEDETYLGYEVPYRTANGRFVSPSELRLVTGFDQRLYGCLAPLLCALPEQQVTAINVNTASAALIAALADDDKLSLADAEKLVEGRGEEGYATVVDFLKLPEVSGIGIDAKYLTVASGYFLGSSQVTAGRGRIALFSLFQRKGKIVTVVGRSIGTY